MRLALLQLSSEIGSETMDPRKANLERALDAIDEAARQGAELAVLGELFLCGYRTDHWIHRWVVATDPPDEFVQELIETARRHKMHVIIGAATAGKPSLGEIYNSALIVGPPGVIGVYRKIHVAAFTEASGPVHESSFFAEGRELSIFPIADTDVGIHICYDIDFPEVPRVQVLMGAGLLVNVSASVKGYEEEWTHLLYTRALENCVWYAVASVVGTQKDTVFFGGSCVVDPAGRTVAAAKTDQEDIIVAEVDTSILAAFRATTHRLTARRPELYRRLSEPTAYP